MTGFALGSRSKHRRNVIVTFDIGLGGKIQLAAIGLRFASERVFKILFSLTILQCHGVAPNICG